MAGARSNPVAVPAGKKVEGTSAYEEASLGAFATSVPYEPARAHSVLEQQSPGEFSDTDRSEGQRSRSDSDILVDAYRVMPLHIRSQAEQWELPRQELEFRSKIGAGRGGVAYQCSWRGLDCMAKMLPDSSDTKSEKSNFSMVDQLSPEWNDMISELSTISHLRHPNLVLFLGACTREGPLIILNEYLPGGNLEDYLNSRPRARGSYKVKLSVALGWGLDLARAICYLHNCNSAVVHRDLKPENLLLADDLRLKISDFGLSKTLMKEDQDSTQPHLQPGGEAGARWLATEILLNMPDCDEKVDIYAMAMILWYILTESFPFGNLHPTKILDHVSREGGRPPLHPVETRVGPELAGLLQWCWHAEPALRPPAERVVEELEAVAHGSTEGKPKKGCCVQ